MRSGTEDSNCHLETVLMGDLPNTARVKSWHGRLTPTKEASEMNDPPTTTPRAHELYLLIQRDLEVARTAARPEREAVLLRVSSRIRELATLAGAEMAANEKARHGRSTREWWCYMLARISVELLKIQSGTDFYTLQRGHRTYATSRASPFVGSGDETTATSRWPVAA